MDQQYIIPREIFAHIFSFCVFVNNFVQWKSISLACKHFREVLKKEEHHYVTLQLRYYSGPYDHLIKIKPYQFLAQLKESIEHIPIAIRFMYDYHNGKFPFNQGRFHRTSTFMQIFLQNISQPLYMVLARCTGKTWYLLMSSLLVGCIVPKYNMQLFVSSGRQKQSVESLLTNVMIPEFTKYFGKFFEQRHDELRFRNGSVITVSVYSAKWPDFNRVDKIICDDYLFYESYDLHVETQRRNEEHKFAMASSQAYIRPFEDTFTDYKSIEYIVYSNSLAISKPE